MSKFPSFMEYMNAKGKIVDSPETETVPDYHGPDEKTPPDSKVPYKTPLANKKPAEGESGLAELGDDKLKYDPTKGSKAEVKKDVMKEYIDEKGEVLEKGREDLKADYKTKVPAAPKDGKPYVASAVKPGDKALGELGDEDMVYEPDTKKAPKVATKTENFLNKTKGMSLSEFTKYMLEECGCGQVQGDELPYVTAYSTGKIQPHPPETIRYISALAGKNGGILENLVSTMVNMGYLNTLLKTVFSYPQAYEELTSLLSDENDGPGRCKSFVGAMNNSYSKFLSDQDGLYESVGAPIGFDDEIDSEDSEDSEDSDEDDMDMDSDEDDMDMDSDEDDMDMDSDEDEGEDEGEDDAGMGSEDEDDMDFDSEDDMDMGKPKEKKLKKKFAHDHLLDAMRNHEYMLKRMRG